MVGTESIRQYNTQALRDRGGAHIFYGLAEIKIDEWNIAKISAKKVSIIYTLLYFF